MGRTRAEAARRLARALARGRDPRRHHQPRPARWRSCASRSSWPAQPTPGYLTRHDPAALGRRAAARRRTRWRRRWPGRQRTAPRPRSWARCRPAGATSIPRRSASATRRGREYAVAYHVLGDTVRASVNDEPSRCSSTPPPGPRRPGSRRDPAPVPGAPGRRHRRRACTAGAGTPAGPHRGASTYVDASDGSSALSEVPRFGDPDRRRPPGRCSPHAGPGAARPGRGRRGRRPPASRCSCWRR